MNKIIMKCKGLFFLSLALGLALLAPYGTPSISCAEEAAPLEINVFYIPREDLPRAPGYADDGLFLPLSELLSLAQMASQKREVLPEALPVSCSAIRLSGKLSNALFIDGVLEYNAPSEGWSASLVEDCLFPWTSQTPQADKPAFLARIKGKTYLFARGPAKGTLSLKALFPLKFDHSQASLSLGPFYAPCRLDLDLDDSVEFVPSESVVFQKDPALKNRGTVFLSTQKASRLAVKSVTPFHAPRALRANIDRTVSVVGAGIRVVDVIFLQDAFSPGAVLDFPLPENLRFLRIENRSSAFAEVSSDTLTIKPMAPLDAIRLELTFTADMKDNSATLGTWNIPALFVEASLTMRSSDQYALLPSQLPPTLLPLEGEGSVLRYSCWENLPETRVSLARRTPVIPPIINAEMNISRNEAIAFYTAHIRDKNIFETRFDIPQDWILSDLSLKRENVNLPFNLAHKGKTTWRVTWVGGENPDTLCFTLRRAGAWGAPGTIEELETPFVVFDGFRPDHYEMTVQKTEGLNIRPMRLAQLIIMTSDEFQSEQSQDSQIDFALKATGEKPGGALSIEGRDADARAVVVTALSVGDDRNTVRALIDYQVRIAPARYFRFVLPHGTGPDVRFTAPEIREKSLKKTPRGEEWTIVSQGDVLGNFEVVLEWTLERLEKDRPISAPEIRVLDVNSSEGFLILEGSETLQLTIQTKNLSEADISDLPALPWRSDKRTIAAYRYVEPPFTLEVLADKFQPEPLLKGIVKQAEITASFTPQGEEFTQAVYSLTPFAEQQFFEVQLPERAKTWSVQANNQGVKPAMRKTSGGADLLMIPLPLSADQSSEVSIHILYHREATPLDRVSRLLLQSPVLSMPINRVIWNLNLPPGFEYLSFDIESHKATSLHEPIITFLRKAYYPKKILFPEMSVIWVIVLTLMAVSLYFIIRRTLKLEKEKKASLAHVDKKPDKPVKKVGCTFTILELLFVVAIIAILSALAVPNFLEAQSRSKVSRVKADMRSMATGLESYYVDNNAYPPNADILWQGAVKYLSSPFADPFADYKGAPFKYVMGRPAVEKAIQAGFLPPDYPVTDDKGFWMIYSAGPDTTDDGGSIIYDPTNGTISAGDVIRIKNGGTPRHSPRYRQVREQEMAVKEREGISQAPPAPTPAPPAPASVARSDADVDMPTFQKTPVSILQDSYLRERMVGGEIRFLAGIQSLSIEIPAGGIQRSMESLLKEPRPEVRFLKRSKFLRLRFLSWIAPLLLMLGVWIYKRGWYERAFLIAMAVVLIVPLFKPSPWTVFFNSAFLGILCSLIAPVVFRSTRRYLNAPPSPSMILILLIPLLALHPSSYAQNPFLDVPDNPIGLIVPYGTERIPGSDEDPLAFISRETFALLWERAWKEPAPPSGTEPQVVRLALTGALSPDGSHIRGTISVYAMNPNDVPASLGLKMKQVALPSFPLDSDHAFLESTHEGLVLQMKSRWMGELAVPFVLSCNTRGDTGRFQIEFPEIAVGFWRIEFPYPRISANSKNKAPFIHEQTPEGSAISGWTTPGLLEISWKGETVGAPLVSSVQDKNWRASFGTRFVWNALSFADFSSIVKIEKKDVSGSLPENITLLKSPSLHILSAQGEGLIETRISETEVAFKLGKTDKAQISIQGFLVKPETIPGKDPLEISWIADGVRVPDGIESQSVLSFDISDQIEITSVNVDGLRRRPSRKLTPGFSTQQYETIHPDWEARFSLKPNLPVFDADIRELWAPVDGFLHRLSDITLIPGNSRVTRCAISLPEGSRVMNLSGDNVVSWAQNDSVLFIAFHPALESEATVRVFATSDLEETEILAITPLSVSNAAEVKRAGVVLVSPDHDLQDIDLAGAISRAPAQKDRDLLHDIPLNVNKETFSLRAYALSSSKPLRFRISPVEATALYAVFNQVNVSDGLQSLDAVVRVEPRRGRIRKISALLILSAPDSQAPARLRVIGAVRDVRTQAISDRIFRITADLTAPRSESVDTRFQIESPVNAENDSEITVSILAPEQGPGARTLLLLRRSFEGELNLIDKTGVRIVDPAELRRPEIGFIPLPSDQSFELSTKTDSGPAFLVARHKREEALRAVVEILRQRTIITTDGVERSELEIVLQNKSEQFLKIALPYPRADLNIYEVLVAGRPVKTAFGVENKRNALMIPLIRTGLLEPELTVRVAYVVHNREPFKVRGTREQKLPDILGGIPVAQSALILMTPSSFKCYDFKGSLNQVQLLDIEVDEALRQAKQVEKLSEAVLYTKGEKQQKLLDNLVRYKSKASATVKHAQSTSRAYERQSGLEGKASGRIEDKKEQELSLKRGASLQMAQQAEQNIGINLYQATQMVQAQQAVTQSEIQSPRQLAPEVSVKPLPPPITFPRAGDAFVFRQLQGAGYIRFKYASRQFQERKKDILVLLIFFLALSLLIHSGFSIFSSRRRIIGLLLVCGLVSIFFGFALDVAIPMLGVSLILFHASKRKASG